MPKYGVTPWGKEFITSMEHLADSGRLTRGRTYANTGRARDIKINNSTVSAKVQGSTSRPYSVMVKFTPFKKTEIEKTLNIIKDNPLILAQILNGNLPKDLLQILKEENISLIPSSWNEMSRSCSCPDWGDPCKHMASVYYLLTSNIDKNPFVLFELRAIDLKYEFNVTQNDKIPYPITLNKITNEKIKKSHNENNTLTKPYEMRAFEDFSHFILSLITPNPLFSDIDYKEVFEEFYKKSKKQLPLIISASKNEDIEKLSRLLQNAKIELIAKTEIYGSHFKISSEFIKDKNIKTALLSFTKTIEDEYFTISSINLFRLFVSFENEHGSKTYSYLFFLYRTIYMLIHNNGFIPNVLENTNGFNIIYKALISSPSIKETFTNLSTQAELISYIEDLKLDHFSQTEFIASLALSEYVKELNFKHKRRKNNPPLVSYTFFEAKHFKTDNFTSQEVSKSIYNYFSIFDVTISDYNYHLHIDKQKIDFLLSMKIVKKDENIRSSLKQSALCALPKEFDEIQILKTISPLIDFLPELKELLKIEQITLKKDRLEHFLFQTADIVKNLGVQIILPKELKNLLRPKPILKANSKSKNFKSFFDLEEMLDFNWQISIGEHHLSIEEFELMVKSSSELLEFKGNYVVLNSIEIQNILKTIQAKKSITQYDILHAKLNDEISFDADIDRLLDEMLKVKEIPVPNTLKATLREYQSRGVSWAINNLLNGFGVILADDMGLGKTLQSLAIILYLKEQKHIEKRVLIVVPTSLLNNWAKELIKFAPTLSFHTYHGVGRSIEKSDILITSYALARRDAQLIKKEKIDLLIIDEAQTIKNSNSTTAKEIKKFKAKYKIALSGTPVENSLSELWSIFDFALPKYLKTLKDFQNTYAKDIEIYKDKEKIKRLKNITAPFMLRRLKSDKDIIKDLPQKIITNEYITMSTSQAAMYESVVKSAIERLESEEGAKKGAIVLQLMTSLKQICNHPRNFDGVSESDIELSGKTKMLMQLLENILEQNEKVLIFTQYTKMGDILENMIKKHLLTTPLYLKGSISKKKRDELVQTFEEKEESKIFILSLKAGGVGLNLTKANHVIHYDLWFNPAVENQATDRAYRIGQKKNVNVHRFITQNSFEEKIDKIISAKKELSELSVNIGEKWIGDMGNDELKSLFELKQE